VSASGPLAESRALPLIVVSTPGREPGSREALAGFCAVRRAGSRARERTAAARMILFIGEAGLFIGPRRWELKITLFSAMSQYMTIKSFIVFYGY
jgi:hypothetical protein